MDLLTMFFAFLEYLGLRCSKCGSWENFSSIKCLPDSRTEDEELGDLLLDEPSYVTLRVCTCAKCGHKLFSRTIYVQEM